MGNFKSIKHGLLNRIPSSRHDWIRLFSPKRELYKNMYEVYENMNNCMNICLCIECYKITEQALYLYFKN